MLSFLYVIYVLVCFGLMIAILLQSSKGGGLAGAFGGGGDMGAVFGGRGAATFLSRMTTGFATVFLLMSVLISVLNRGQAVDGGLVQQEQQRRSSVPASVPIVPTEETEGLIPGETSLPEFVTPGADSTE